VRFSVSSSLSAVLVPASVCGGMSTATKNADEFFLGK
jgi:hypothetical protein